MEVIYKITSPSKKIYIGRTKDFDERMKQHKGRSVKNKNNNVLYRAVNKYGWDNFTKEIIAEVNSVDAPEMEELMMIKYNSVKGGYNMTYATMGGDVWKGRRDTPEYIDYKELQSRLQSAENNGFYGKTHTKENIKKMSHPGYKNGMFGKKHGQDTIMEMKKKAAGRFSLPWFQDKYGDIEGQVKYDERCTMLGNRNMKKDRYGRFISS